MPQRSDDAAAQQGGSITEVDAVEVRLSVYHAFLHSSALFVYPIEYDVLTVSYTHLDVYKRQAEGIETGEQHQALQEAGCTRVQGYRVGRPQPIEEFERRFLAT